MAAFRSRLLRLGETTTEELLEDALLHLGKNKRTERAAPSCLHHTLLLHRKVINRSDQQSCCQAIIQQKSVKIYLLN